jgi:selenoprotein W-related protein
MVDSLLEEFEHDISSLDLIPSRGGVFEVTVDGDLIYSKKQTGKHAEYEDVAGPIRERSGG